MAELNDLRTLLPFCPQKIVGCCLNQNLGDGTGHFCGLEAAAFTVWGSLGLCIALSKGGIEEEGCFSFQFAIFPNSRLLTHIWGKKKNAGVIHCPRFVLSSMIRERGYKHNLVSVSLFSLPWKNFCA